MNGPERVINGSIERRGAPMRRPDMRPLAILAIVIAMGAGIAGAQMVRTGLRTPILPGGITIDTLWFLPPAEAGNPPLTRIVRNVTVRIDTLVFPLDQALDISLLHAGVNDSLLDGLRNSGAGFEGTLFADSAAQAIGGGFPPFTGAFVPARPLSQFTGRDATGSWMLRIINHSTDRSGMLKEWGIGLDISTTFTSVTAHHADVPERLLLYQNFPNPFNPSTTIRYGLPARLRVSLTLFNALGEQIAILAAGEQEAGFHQVSLDGVSLATGVYFCRLEAGTFAETKRMLLLK
jgi:hypothetical protein